LVRAIRLADVFRIYYQTLPARLAGLEDVQMPTYEYECESCGHRYEKFHAMSVREKSCPKCKGPVRRLIGAGGAIIFKGPGFHANDYRSDLPPCGRRKACGPDAPCQHKE
jgi:putative FmdB family regulatory protein